MMNITEIRKNTIKLARKSSNITNSLKGIHSYVLANSKKSKLKNDIIQALIDGGLYVEIYNKFIESDNDLSNLNDKEIDILNMFQFAEPDDLIEFKEGLKITETKLF